MVAVLKTGTISTSNRLLGLDGKAVLQHHDSQASIKKERTTPATGSSGNSSNNRGWRSRGWTPLLYPKSSLFDHQGEHQQRNAYFPFHQDVILAAVRELLILDGTVNWSTLKVSNASERFLRGHLPGDDDNSSNNTSSNNSESSAASVDIIPRYVQHLEPQRWRMLQAVPLALKSSTNGRNSSKSRKKRKKSPLPNKKSGKRLKVEPAAASLERAGVVHNGDRHLGGERLTVDYETLEPLHPPSAEHIANKILLRARMVGSDDGSDNRHVDKFAPLSTPEGNDTSSFSVVVAGGRGSGGVVTMEEEDDKALSHFLNLSERTVEGTFPLRVAPKNLPFMVHTSISTEATLRDAAMIMTTQLVESFTDTPLRLFLGYKKTPTVVGRDRLIRLLAAVLFDVSHAMFAWEQTEQELLQDNTFCKNSTTTVEDDMDAIIQKTLFDGRALCKIGGFEPSSLLPHAISIGRLRRRKSLGHCHDTQNRKNSRRSWEFFATTAQGKRMMAHHSGRRGGSVSVVSVGKQRRGQRLRQRHWLTSSLLGSETECDASSTSSSSDPAGTRSRTSSIASYDDAATATGCHTHHVLVGARLHQARILAEMPGTMAATLVKESFGTSWGVLLSKEGDMCVVARGAKAVVAHGREPQPDQQLECGDLIIHVQNDQGQEAVTPLCFRSFLPSNSYNGNGKEGEPLREDWFRAIVDLFKTSQELHVIIQRVRAPVN